MAPPFAQNSPPTTQDLKITTLLTSLPLATLQTYFRHLVLSPLETKDREQALLLLGMITYKSNPPKKIWDDSLYEYVGMLGRYVKRCEREIREDAKYVSHVFPVPLFI